MQCVRAGVAGAVSDRFISFGSSQRNEYKTMKIGISKLPVVVSFACVLAALSVGCGQEGNSREVAAIKTNYVAFRSALIASNFDRAKELVSKGYLVVFSPERVLRSYGWFLGTNGVLTEKAFVRFGPDFGPEQRAWLWPQAPPEIGSSAIGFIRETNGWKLDGDFLKVTD